jgi:hypothetical protein
LSGGEVLVWLDPDGGVCIKTVEPHGDPVELSDRDALDLAGLLTRLAEESSAS